MEIFDRAVNIHLGVRTQNTCGYATLLSEIGLLKAARGDLNGAFSVCHQARSIREKTRTLASTPGAELLTTIGGLKNAQGDLAGALELYQEAQEIFKDLKR